MHQYLQTPFRYLTPYFSMRRKYIATYNPHLIKNTPGMDPAETILCGDAGELKTSIQ